MPQLREDPTTGQWVVIAPQRAHRPHAQGASSQEHQATGTKARVRFDPECAFCPGNEDQTPPETDRLRRPRSQTESWQTRSFPNQYPAFTEQAQGGAHEVIVETPDHEKRLHELDDEEIALVFEAYHRRHRALRERTDAQWISLFKNHGRQAGASMSHAHAQIIAAPKDPPLQQRRNERSQAHHKEHGTCLLCDLAAQERSQGDRIILEQEEITVFAPYASSWPYEIWVTPPHKASFIQTTDQERRHAGLALRNALRRLQQTLPETPYNFVLHSASTDQEDAPHSHWWIQITPRLARTGGFEIASGTRINPTAPEEAARTLRAPRMPEPKNGQTSSPID